MTQIEFKVFNEKHNLLSVEVVNGVVRVSLTDKKTSLGDSFSIEDARELARFILDHAHQEGVK